MGSQSKGGERTDIENLVLDFWGPGLTGASRPGCHLSRGRFCLLCMPPSPAPNPRGQQKSLPEHAGPTHPVAECKASLRSQRESVSRQDKSPGLFYRAEQEHSPPSSHPEQELGPRQGLPTHSGGTHCHRHRACLGPLGWKRPVSYGHC